MYTVTLLFEIYGTIVLTPDCLHKRILFYILPRDRGGSPNMWLNKFRQFDRPFRVRELTSTNFVATLGPWGREQMFFHKKISKSV